MNVTLQLHVNIICFMFMWKRGYDSKTYGSIWIICPNIIESFYYIWTYIPYIYEMINIPVGVLSCNIITRTTIYCAHEYTQLKW